jgi:hypothetical protein
MPDEKSLTPKQRRALFKEWREDYASARGRDIFGEGAIRPKPAPEPAPKPDNEKARDGGMEM